MFKKSWVGDYADEENFMSLFYSKNFSPVGSNYTHYKNPDFDILFEKANSEQNDSIKISMYQQMDQMIIDDAPIIPLYYDQIIRLVHKNIKDLTTNPMNLLNLKLVEGIKEGGWGGKRRGGEREKGEKKEKKREKKRKRKKEKKKEGEGGKGGSINKKRKKGKWGGEKRGGG